MTCSSLCWVYFTVQFVGIFIFGTIGLLGFAVGLFLLTFYAERESRRNFTARSNWRYLQTHFLHRLSTSNRLERVMQEDCPKELEWMRQVGDGAGLVPLHTEKVHKRIGVSADKILYSGNFRRAMYGENLRGFRIPANNIEELEVYLGHGGQATVSKGRWKRWGGRHVDVAIKKWGSRNIAKTVDELAKYQNEVKVLVQLNHRSVSHPTDHSCCNKCRVYVSCFSFAFLTDM